MREIVEGELEHGDEDYDIAEANRLAPIVNRVERKSAARAKMADQANIKANERGGKEEMRVDEEREREEISILSAGSKRTLQETADVSEKDDEGVKVDTPRAKTRSL